MPPSTGKYYSDDGPPERVPGEPRRNPGCGSIDEPFHRFANRPYTVFGQSYAPVVNKEPRKERGIASWYGRKFHGQKTASGETYDMFAMTAAHKTFPIPSFARVTSVKTGKSVVVRVNDRGPFHSDRIIDLSYAAASRIGIAEAGSGLVEVERVFAGPPPVDSASVTPLPQPVATTIETPVIAQEAAGLWVQLGAFSSADTAKASAGSSPRRFHGSSSRCRSMRAKALHRVRAGPLSQSRRGGGHRRQAAAKRSATRR
jgi:rare lipoprotein A